MDPTLWRIDLDEPPGRLPELTRLLSPEERTRAERFRFPRHRRRFLVARAGLRRILGRILDVDPGEVAIVLDPGGKPRTNSGALDLRFNLSHSEDQALLATTVGREVGVDLEWIDPRTEVLKLSRRFFAPEEADRLAEMPAGERRAEFFRVWTLKEAYLKNLGTGLGVRLSSFAVSAREIEPPVLTRTDHGDPGAWSLRSYRLGTDLAAALVVEGTLEETPPVLEG